MRRGNWGEDPELLQAHARNSVIRVATLARLGVPSTTTYYRCRPGRQWQRLLPGVVMLGNARPSRRQLLAAALLYAGPDSVVTGVDACRMHGLREATQEDRVHVLVPAERKINSAGFVLVERTTRLPRAALRRDAPATPVARACLDTCRRMIALGPCRALLAEAIQRDMTTHAQLVAELNAGSPRGAALPRRALAELADGAHSVAEINAGRIWQRAGLPPACWNGLLLTASGEVIASPDAWIDDVAFAWEIDSLAHHAGPDGFARTLTRNARYAAAGVVSLQTLPSRLRTEPDAVVRELRAAYETARARPRPAVIFQPRQDSAAA